jgi:hypothetical protein
MKMMGRAHQNSRNTKVECNCGRRMCSRLRAFYRREQRRIERQGVAREIREAQR